MPLIETYIDFKKSTYKITIDRLPSRTFIYFFHFDIIALYGGQQEFDINGKWVKKEWPYPTDHIDLVRKLESLLKE